MNNRRTAHSHKRTASLHRSSYLHPFHCYQPHCARGVCAKLYMVRSFMTLPNHHCVRTEVTCEDTRHIDQILKHTRGFIIVYLYPAGLHCTWPQSLHTIGVSSLFRCSQVVTKHTFRKPGGTHGLSGCYCASGLYSCYPRAAHFQEDSTSFMTTARYSCNSACPDPLPAAFCWGKRVRIKHAHNAERND